MRTGKISENVLTRSILKRCKSKNDSVAQGPAIGQDCAIVRIKDSKEAAMSTQTVTKAEDGQIRMAIYGCANNLYCSKAEPVSLMAGYVLPEEAEESVLRELVDEADETCRELGISLAGGHTEVSESVQKPIASFTCMGISKETVHATRELTSGLELVITGWIGKSGTALLARRYEEELKKRFPWQLVEDACGFDRELSVKNAALVGWEQGVVSMHDVSEGGIFGALWEFGESSGTGLEVELRKIPIRQETIEICEIYDRNPYQLLSGGCLLMAVKDGTALCDRLEEAGITARVIGWTTEKREKILKNGDEIRFLDKPVQDQIWKK